jgi:hypothetical protein
VLSPDEVAGLGNNSRFSVGDLAGAENAFNIADASADRITEAPMKAHHH